MIKIALAVPYKGFIENAYQISDNIMNFTERLIRKTMRWRRLLSPVKM